MINKIYLKKNKRPYLQYLFRCKITKNLVKIFPQRHFFLQGYSQKGTGGNVFMNGVKSEVLFKECVEKINLWIDWEKLKVKR